jgi:CheY-like chemotaxis protein
MLIADDDIISRKLILKSVHEFAKEIIEAKTGREAIEKFKENTNVDLILIDVQMPDINGYEATKEIRELNSDVIIITQSAFFGLMETGMKRRTKTHKDTDNFLVTVVWQPG